MLVDRGGRAMGLASGRSQAERWAAKCVRTAGQVLSPIARWYASAASAGRPARRRASPRTAQYGWNDASRWPHSGANRSSSSRHSRGPVACDTAAALLTAAPTDGATAISRS
ncbi:hypothetical protein [Botrimarina sp.]|uniref:hypothetical protein n=1 Tax=Botrimarina sp. TaxID=2795802 RepID=UPI0032EB2EAD